MKAKELTGQQFGRWIVLERDYSINNGRTNWKCQCTCNKHTIKIIDGYSLTSGRSKSCGCLKKELNIQNFSKKKDNVKDNIKQNKHNIDYNNHNGEIYNNLKIISYVYTKNKKRYYNCLCLNCGNQKIVRYSNLINNHTQSCGCLKSNGEKIISKILQENNISYVKEKTFDNCRYTDTNYPARFDFYINNEYLLEYDGIQHFQMTKGWNTEQNFNTIKQHDEFKEQWCKENNIPLIRIPYIQLPNLSLQDVLLNTSKFIVQ